MSGVINFSSFERAIEYLRIDGDWAIIMGADTVTPIGNAPLSGQIVQRRFTNVREKEAGTWRLFTRHANITHLFLRRRAQVKVVGFEALRRLPADVIYFGEPS